MLVFVKKSIGVLVAAVALTVGVSQAREASAATQPVDENGHAAASEGTLPFFFPSDDDDLPNWFFQGRDRDDDDPVMDRKERREEERERRERWERRERRERRERERRDHDRWRDHDRRDHDRDRDHRRDHDKDHGKKTGKGGKGGKGGGKGGKGGKK
jgi:hypothetical protein